MREGIGASECPGPGGGGDPGPAWAEGRTAGTEDHIRGRAEVRTWAGAQRDTGGAYEGDLWGMEVRS